MFDDDTDELGRNTSLFFEDDLDNVEEEKGVYSLLSDAHHHDLESSMSASSLSSDAQVPGLKDNSTSPEPDGMDSSLMPAQSESTSSSQAEVTALDSLSAFISEPSDTLCLDELFPSRQELTAQERIEFETMARVRHMKRTLPFIPKIRAFFEEDKVADYFFERGDAKSVTAELFDKSTNLVSLNTAFLTMKSDTDIVGQWLRAGEKKSVLEWFLLLQPESLQASIESILVSKAKAIKPLLISSKVLGEAYQHSLLWYLQEAEKKDFLCLAIKKILSTRRPDLIKELVATSVKGSNPLVACSAIEYFIENSLNRQTAMQSIFSSAPTSSNAAISFLLKPSPTLAVSLPSGDVPPQPAHAHYDSSYAAEYFSLVDDTQKDNKQKIAVAYNKIRMAAKKNGATLNFSQVLQNKIDACLAINTVSKNKKNKTAGRKKNHNKALASNSVVECPQVESVPLNLGGFSNKRPGSFSSSAFFPLASQAQRRRLNQDTTFVQSSDPAHYHDDIEHSMSTPFLSSDAQIRGLEHHSISPESESMNFLGVLIPSESSSSSGLMVDKEGDRTQSQQVEPAKGSVYRERSLFFIKKIKAFFEAGRGFHYFFDARDKQSVIAGFLNNSSTLNILNTTLLTMKSDTDVFGQSFKAGEEKSVLAWFLLLEPDCLKESIETFLASRSREIILLLTQSVSNIKGEASHFLDGYLQKGYKEDFLNQAIEKILSSQSAIAIEVLLTLRVGGEDDKTYISWYLQEAKKTGELHRAIRKILSSQCSNLIKELVNTSIQDDNGIVVSSALEYFIENASDRQIAMQSIFSSSKAHSNPAILFLLRAGPASPYQSYADEYFSVLSSEKGVDIKRTQSVYYKINKMAEKEAVERIRSQEKNRVANRGMMAPSECQEDITVIKNKVMSEILSQQTQTWIDAFLKSKEDCLRKLGSSGNKRTRSSFAHGFFSPEAAAKKPRVDEDITYVQLPDDEYIPTPSSHDADLFPPLFPRIG